MRSPLLSILAAAVTASCDTGTGRVAAGVSATVAAGPHAVSAGRMSVAICPGTALAAAIAAAPSAATFCEFAEVRTQCDMGRARPSISDVSGAL